MLDRSCDNIPKMVKHMGVVMGVVVLCYASIAITHTSHYFLPRNLLSRPSPTAEEVVPEWWWREPVCGANMYDAMEKPLTYPILMRNVTPGRQDHNVFIIDSACNTHPKYRAWCSVESWANQNPHLDVWFLQTAPTLEDLDNLPSHLLRHYPNMHIVGMDLVKMFKGTPLDTLFNSKVWLDKDTWPINHLSDMSRVLALWHWGGSYSDTDILCIKNFTVPFSAVGLENHEVIGNAFLGFTHHHPVVWKLMEDMKTHFDKHQWGSIGPHAVTRVIKSECPDNDISVEGAPHYCNHNITLHPPSSFFPIPWRQYKKYFEHGKGMDKEVANSYLIHIWNKKSKTETAELGSNSIYETAAKRFCPITYHQATLRSNTF